MWIHCTPNPSHQTAAAVSYSVHIWGKICRSFLAHWRNLGPFSFPVWSSLLCWDSHLARTVPQKSPTRKMGLGFIHIHQIYNWHFSWIHRHLNETYKTKQNKIKQAGQNTQISPANAFALQRFLAFVLYLMTTVRSYLCWRRSNISQTLRGERTDWYQWMLCATARWCWYWCYTYLYKGHNFHPDQWWVTVETDFLFESWPNFLYKHTVCNLSSWIHLQLSVTQQI